MADKCEKHFGEGSKADPDMDGIMEKLPPSQAGAGRHKCTYCAYEVGYERGRRDGIDDLRRRVAEWLAGEEDGPPE